MNKGIMLACCFIVSAHTLIVAQPLTPAEKEFVLIMHNRLNDILRQHVVRDFDGNVVRIVPFKKSIERQSIDAAIRHLENYAQKDATLPELRNIAKMKPLLDRIPVASVEGEIIRTLPTGLSDGPRIGEVPEVVINRRTKEDFDRYLNDMARDDICSSTSILSDSDLSYGIILAFDMVEAGTEVENDKTALLSLLQELDAMYDVDCNNDQNEVDNSLIRQKFNQRREWCELFWQQLLTKIEKPLFWNNQKNQAQSLLLRIVDEIMDYCSAQSDGDNALLVNDVRAIAEKMQGTPGQKKFFNNIVTIFGGMVDVKKDKDVIREFVTEDNRKDWNSLMATVFDELSQYSPDQVIALINIAVNGVNEPEQKEKVRTALNNQYRLVQERRAFFGAHGVKSTARESIEKPAGGDNASDDALEIPVESNSGPSEHIVQSQQESVVEESQNVDQGQNDAIAVLLEQRLGGWDKLIVDIKASKNKSPEDQDDVLGGMHEYALGVMKVAKNKEEMLTRLKGEFAQAVKEIMSEDDSKEWIEKFNKDLDQALHNAHIIVKKHGG